MHYALCIIALIAIIMAERRRLDALKTLLRDFLSYSDDEIKGTIDRMGCDATIYGFFRAVKENRGPHPEWVDEWTKCRLLKNGYTDENGVCMGCWMVKHPDNGAPRPGVFYCIKHKGDDQVILRRPQITAEQEKEIIQKYKEKRRKEKAWYRSISAGEDARRYLDRRNNHVGYSFSGLFF